MRNFLTFIKIFLLIFLLAKNSVAQEKTKEELVFVASIKPVYDILLAITKDKNNSILLFSQQFANHDYQLKKSDILALSKAKAIFYIDDSLENILAKMVKNYSLQKKSYQLSKIEDLKIINKDRKKIDPHLWLDLENAVQIALFITDKLCEINQNDCAFYQKNYLEFAKKIGNFAAKNKDSLANLTKGKFVLFHDGYQYFTEYFSLNPEMIFMQNNHGEISIKSLRKFNKIYEEKQVSCVFGEALWENNSAQKLAQKYDLKFIALDSLGLQNPANENAFLKMMQNLVLAFKSCN